MDSTGRCSGGCRRESGHPKYRSELERKIEIYLLNSIHPGSEVDDKSKSVVLLGIRDGEITIYPGTLERYISAHSK